jgi:hypothetical protein
MQQQQTSIVLERIARGGGETRWYRCAGTSSLDDVCGRLTPGSRVSFYFDERIQAAPFTAEVGRAMMEVIARTGDVVAGRLMPDGVRIEVEFLTGPNDLAEWVAGLAPNEVVYFGPVPAADDDGESCMTITLPDADGVVRNHPH